MENKHIYKPFLSTLIDSVLYAKYASNSNDEKLKKLLAKASILHCCLTIEALANNMVQFINLGSKFSESVDKLDVISKFEMFSLMVKKKNIDRGSSSIQTFKQLIDLRNNYVHPKIKTVELNNENGNYTTKLIPNYKQIKINVNSQKWDVKDSNECVLALLKGIDEFLLTELRLEMKSMSCMFLDFLFIDGMQGPIVDTKSEWVSWSMSEYKYKPKFYCDHILKRYE